MSNIDEAVRMWELYREGTIAELANIPEEHWDFRPGPGSRSLRELALHITGSAVGFANELLADEPSFARLRGPEAQAAIAKSLGELNTKDEILAAMKARSAESAQRLRENGERLASSTMASMGGQQSRLSGLWFAAAHEMYHRGQVTVYARALNLVPAMTQKTSKPK